MPYIDTSAGRPWHTADKAACTLHPEGDATLRLEWLDGACLTFDTATHQEAREWLTRNGFAPAQPA